MSRLSLSIDAIQSDYDVVVIGSGYGGGIAASRMSRAGRRVCVLERGKEFQPGEYPNTEMEALAEMQTHLPDGSHLGDRTSLYDLHCNQQLNVMVGCGLGGTSQLNANVSLEADPRVFDDPRWPAEVVKDIPTLVQQGYERAREMLKPTPYPMGEPHPDPKVGKWPELPKLNALQASFKALGNPIGKFYRPPINVTFEDKVNHAGVQQKACTLCGDCCSGCNYGAKNTVIMNYLPDAVNHGAEIFTRITSVRGAQGCKWLIHCEVLGSAGKSSMRRLDSGRRHRIHLRGNPGIDGNPVASRATAWRQRWLGQRLTGNGDVVAFGYNGDRVINGIGFGHQSPGAVKPVGPCITGIIDMRATPMMTDGMVTEEGSVPGALGPAMTSALIDARCRRPRRAPRNPGPREAKVARAREPGCRTLSRRGPSYADLSGDVSR